MKRVSLIGLGAVALIASVPFIHTVPGLNILRSAGVAVAQTKNQPIQLRLNVDRQVMQQDKQGNKQTIWQPLEGKVSVRPGDLLRYTVSGENAGDKAVKNLVVNQPIPRQTIYVLNSASVGQNSAAKIAYSIDNGKNFVAKPEIQVKQANGKVVVQPAPAAAYTHIRWTFTEAIGPATKVNAIYQVKVR